MSVDRTYNIVRELCLFLCSDSRKGESSRIYLDRGKRSDECLLRFVMRTVFRGRRAAFRACVGGRGREDVNLGFARRFRSSFNVNLGLLNFRLVELLRRNGLPRP